MENTFYRMLDDVNAPNRWWLKAPYDDQRQPINPEIFRYAQKLELRTPLTIPVRTAGNPLDFTFGSFEMPVTTARTTAILQDLGKDDFQHFPARVEGHEGNFQVINFLKKIECLDQRRSDVLFWTEVDGRPDKIGQYRQVANLRIVSSRVHGAEIFRLAGWEIALIVSPKVKDRFEQEGLTGVRFVSVT